MTEADAKTNGRTANGASRNVAWVVWHEGCYRWSLGYEEETDAVGHCQHLEYHMGIMAHVVRLGEVVHVGP